MNRLKRQGKRGRFLAGHLMMVNIIPLLLLFIPIIGDIQNQEVKKNLAAEVPREQVRTCGMSVFRFDFLAEYVDGRLVAVRLIRNTTRISVSDRDIWPYVFAADFAPKRDLRGVLVREVPLDQIPVNGKKVFRGTGVIVFDSGKITSRGIYLVHGTTSPI